MHGESFEAGVVVAQRYEILELLGKGGMGEVYAARDRKLRRRVAIKTILQSASVLGSVGTERLRAEAEMLAQLAHPGIVAVHDVLEESDRVLLVMELIEGVSLRERLKTGPLPVHEVIEIATALGSALAAAHAHGLVHRDVKPDNVMIRRDGRVALLDFGIAKETPGGAGSATSPQRAPITEPGAFLGTPMYLSPEQARGVAVGPASDQFSLGVVVYELLAGKVPWPSDNLLVMVTAILQGAIDPVAPARGLDAEVDAVLGRALAKQPSERYPSTRDFADALAAALGRNPGSEATLARSAHPPPPVITVDSAALPAAVPTASGASRGRRALVGVVVASLAAIGMVMLFVRYGAGHPRSAGRSDVAPASSGSSAGVVRVADLAPSRTSSPAAEASYRRGLRLLGGGESSAAKDAFDAAIEADPAFASPHLQRLIGETYYCPTDLPTARPHYQAAFRAKATLSPRDQEVLDALEPAVLDPPDLGEVAVRMRALVARRPTDLQILEMLAIAENKLFHFGASADAVRRQLAVDPDETMEGLMILAQDVDEEEASRALDDCLRRNEAAEWCRVERTFRYAALGQCKEMESDARTMTVFNPESTYGPRSLVAALAGQNASVDALAVALSSARQRQDTTSAVRSKLWDDVSLALWTGDFAAALAGIDAAGGPGSPGTSVTKVETLWEMGDRKAASEAALAYIKQAVALPRFERPESDPMPRMLARARAGGALSDAEFTAQRDAWIESWHRRLDDEAWKAAASVVWAQAFSFPSTEAEARAAIERLPAFGPLPPVANRQFWTDDGPIGELLLMGGRIDDALPRLRTGANRCAISMSAVRARLDLGRALESTGDVAGACVSYAAVLDRWGKAKPRSVTAATAEKRYAVLGCTSPRP